MSDHEQEVERLGDDLAAIAEEWDVAGDTMALAVVLQLLAIRNGHRDPEKAAGWLEESGYIEMVNERTVRITDAGEAAALQYLERAATRGDE